MKELTDINLNVKFYELCDSLRKTLFSQNIFSTMPTDITRSYFANSPIENRVWIVSNLEKYLELCYNYQISNTTSVWSEKMFLWNCIKLCKWELPEGTMEILSPDDVIEILDKNGRQVFRSLNFFSLTSYDLESFLCLPWSELFERSMEDYEIYAQYFIKCLSDTTNNRYSLEHLPKHHVREIRSLGKLKGDNQPLFCGPVFDIKTNTPVAALHVFRPSNLSRQEETRPTSLRLV